MSSDHERETGGEDASREGGGGGELDMIAFYLISISYANSFRIAKMISQNK